MPSEQKIIVIPDGKICDYIDGKFRNDTPEEYVRQTIEKRLVNEHKYLPEQIRIEYTLQVGSNKPRADIVIWEKGADQTQGTIKLIIECKKETVDARNAKDGIAQLKSYMSVCPNCEWGMWTNSVQKYVYTFLKSKTGNLILRTNGYGSVITHIEPSHLAEIQIPDAPITIREQIHDLIAHSYTLRDESNRMIDRATQLLIENLHLPPVYELEKNPSTVGAHNVKLSDLAGRLDASYHVPIVDAIIEHLKRYAEEVTTVGDPRISREVILPGRFKRVYVNEGYGRVLIGGKQLSELDPSSKKYLSTAKHDKMLKKLEVHEGTTLITRSGTIGKIAIVPKHWEHYIPSDHIIRVIPANKDIAGYLNIFLASDYGKVLITRFTYGSVVDEIDDNHVRQIAIPLLKNHTVQKKINDLALEANEKRYQAYLLEQEALQIMDRDVIYAKK